MVGTVEVNCLKILKGHRIQEFIDSFKNDKISDQVKMQSFHVDGTNLVLKKSHSYYFQVQLQLLITEAKYWLCHLLKILVVDTLNAFTRISNYRKESLGVAKYSGLKSWFQNIFWCEFFDVYSQLFFPLTKNSFYQVWKTFFCFLVSNFRPIILFYTPLWNQKILLWTYILMTFEIELHLLIYWLGQVNVKRVFCSHSTAQFGCSFCPPNIYRYKLVQQGMLCQRCPIVEALTLDR